MNYTPDHIQFLRDNSHSKKAQEIMSLFNAFFGFNKSVDTVKEIMRRNGITWSKGRSSKFTLEQVQFILDSAKSKNKITQAGIASLFYEHFKKSIAPRRVCEILNNNNIRRELTKEQVQFLKDNIKGKRLKEITKLFNDYFNTSLTTTQIKSHAHYRKLKMEVPNSIGLPVNTERLENDYTAVKILIGKQKNWKRKHNLIWEQANGQIPKGHIIIFADQNKSNFSLDNLVLISKGELVRLNKAGMIFNDPELTKTALAVVRHKAAITKLIKEMEGGNERRIFNIHNE
jgi:hypothetical protein